MKKNKCEMQGNEIKILLAEPSCIIKEGFSKILNEDASKIKLTYTDNTDDFKSYINSFEFDLIILNPNLINSSKKELISLKKKYNRSKWLGLIYAYFNSDFLSIFEGLISITDSKLVILDLIKTTIKKEKGYTNEEYVYELSEREIGVLKLLTQGNSNKQIADKLNISTHTVISHRKNIIQKTGIKSVSGLTIYAVINKIIPLK